MIPIRDLNPTRRKPVAVYTIIALNVLVFWVEAELGIFSSSPPREFMLFLYKYGLVPARYSVPRFSESFTALEQVIPFFSSLFIHGSLFHLIGNMWMLWIFGDNIEDWLGPVGFTIFYLYCGIVAGALHLAFNWSSQMPTVGASGAIAGVMGAYMLLYPRARVVALIPIFIFFFPVIQLPAVVFLGLWFLLQLVQGSAGAMGNVAWWAHVGGFAAGAAVVVFAGRSRLLTIWGRR
ncbi:MAG: rhomboid family intramembrane serine protease [Deltaproteobacteria bacterium]|nr:MAG: rhomboid family intramembrane serine protease [Deltaproteobacteria bacterium]